MKKSIDNVTTINLDLALRMVGIKMDIQTIDIIIDLVELLEEKGDDTSMRDICKLQAVWEPNNQDNHNTPESRHIPVNPLEGDY